MNFCINGSKHYSQAYKLLNRVVSSLWSTQFQPQRMHDLPSVEQQNVVRFCAETGFELRYTEVTTK